MIIIRSPADITKARLPPHIAAYIDKLLAGIMRSVPDYNPEHDGHIVLVTPRDTDQDLCVKIGKRWADSMFEGVGYESGIYHAVILHNNQFTVSVVANTDHMDPAIKVRLDHEMA